MNVDELKIDSVVGKLIHSWLRDHRYRIVKYNLPDGDLSWYLLRVHHKGHSDWVEGVNGYDKGSPGEFNYQLHNTGNPIAQIDTLVDLAKWYLKNQTAPWNGRDDLPKTEIVDEIDIQKTINNLLKKATTESTIQELNELIIKKR